jgi:hypothetical protein
MLSKILPHPLPLTLTVVDPKVIDAACTGHGFPGKRCGVFTSPCLLTPIPLTLTFKEPPFLVIPEQ